jgi:hypothetical protein
VLLDSLVVGATTPVALYPVEGVDLRTVGGARGQRWECGDRDGERAEKEALAEVHRSLQNCCAGMVPDEVSPALKKSADH